MYNHMLDTFIAVADCGSFTKASQQLLWALLRCTVISFIICSLPPKKMAGQNLFPCRIIIIYCIVRTNVK